MPNDCETHIFVTGPTSEILRFRRSCFMRNNGTGNPELEFETILPMPDILRGIDVGSSVDLARIALGADPGPPVTEYTMTLDRALELDWVKKASIGSRHDLLSYFEGREPDAVAAARKSIAACEETGFHDWFSWRLANWGTKWGPSSTAILTEHSELLEFSFCTPWNFPEQAFRRLGVLYPDLCFDITARNPDLGIGVQGHVLGGEVSLESMSLIDADDGRAEACLRERRRPERRQDIVCDRRVLST